VRLVAAVAILAPLSAPADPDAEPQACVPTVLLEGDTALVPAVADALAREGIAGIPAPGCPVVRVAVRDAGDGFLVSIVDVHGRLSERTVFDVAGAAAVVASWVRGDLVAPLLADRPGAGTAAPPDDAATIIDRTDPVPPDGEAILGVDVGAETSVALDTSVWFGARLAGCVRLGPTCLGALARFAADPGLAGDSAELDTTRMGLDVLLVVDFPFDLGPVFLTPGAGFGAGWMRSRGKGAGRGTEDDVYVDAGGMRADAHVMLTIPVGAGLSLDFGLGLDVWFLTHTAPFDVDGRSLAGEPRGRLRAGLGLRYGAP
jgi:hypothetical protein